MGVHMKLTTLFLLLFSLLQSPLLYAKTNPLIRRAKESSVQVIVPEVGSGSGVSVYNTKDYSLIMTNDHVCQMTRGTIFLTSGINYSNPINTYRVIVKTFLGEELKGTVIKTANLHKLKEGQRKSDLCVIKIEHVVPAIEIDVSDLEIGDKVFNVSAPIGIFPVIFEGFVGPDRNVDENQHPARVLSVPINSGSSGSGVFSYDTGKIIGIAFAIITVEEGSHDAVVSLMVPAERVKSFLDATLLTLKDNK
jgi:Trypsin-like peptidase domain